MTERRYLLRMWSMMSHVHLHILAERLHGTWTWTCLKIWDRSRQEVFVSTWFIQMDIRQRGPLIMLSNVSRRRRVAED